MGEAIGEATGGWQVVTRKRRSPTPANKPMVNTYKPYRTSNAEAVRSPSSPHKPAFTNQPVTPTSTYYYVSPHSSAKLRFPPSPRFQEWKGRCFRCCRMGHCASKCKNPKKCGRCWGDGHVGYLCKKEGTESQSIPMTSSPAKAPKPRGEPSFDEILHGPIVTRGLPENRPQKVVCFVERDEDYYEERARLEKAVVMYNHQLEIDLTVEAIADYAATSGIVKASEVQVGIMTKSRYVIMLPEKIDLVLFVKAIPSEVWNKGFSFSLWSPLMDATRAEPHFKVVLDLIGIPLDLYREKEVIRAVSSIGTYLGTLKQPMEGDVARWTVVVATTDLELIPHQIGYRVGGVERLIDVFPQTWVHCDVYKPEELPQPRQQFFPPCSPTMTLEKEYTCDEDDHFIGSRRILEELCQSIQFDALPEGVQAVLRGASSMNLRSENFSEDMRQESTTNNSIIQNSQVQTQIAANPSARFEEDTIPRFVSVTRDEREGQYLQIGEEVSPLVMSQPVENLIDTHEVTMELHQTNKVAREEPCELEVNNNMDIEDISEDIGEAGQHKSVLQVTIPIATNDMSYSNHEVVVPVQYAPITGRSLSKQRGKEMFSEGETSNNPPRILQRRKDKAINLQDDTCSHSPRDSRQPREVLAYGPMLLRETTRNKRKSREEAQQKKASHPKGRPRNKKKSQLINNSGLVEVKVAIEHCSKIAQATGFEVSQVLTALDEDNAQRCQNYLDDHVDGYDPHEQGDFVFDLDSEEEFGSDLD